uniref:AlNc14C18G1845 protein n=1 Tax=Albugo laibachii Nc14 TaxID=890382 RepID=F0W4M4_9STRA|nr:AlNc14C18G1845 [Albugo laibachii Nc14]|eukprot:CCA16058.1 AlNc14C18G1845 [Albugo laibachii Nc14]
MQSFDVCQNKGHLVPATMLMIHLQYDTRGEGLRINSVESSRIRALYPTGWIFTVSN